MAVRGTVVVPVGAYGPTYRQDSKSRKHEATMKVNQQTPEQKASWDKIMNDMEARWNAPADPQQRALEKVKDREARFAVEGDTDLNHDNVEAAE